METGKEKNLNLAIVVLITDVITIKSFYFICCSNLVYVMKKSYVTFFLLFLYFIPFLVYSQHERFVMPAEITSDDYVEGRIIFKIKPEVVSYKKSFGEFPEVFLYATGHEDYSEFKRRFPDHAAPSRKYHDSGFPLVDLSRIYFTDIHGDKGLEEAINQLYQTGMVEYAQPHYIPQLLQHYPNDPRLDDQYYLENIRAFDAWEISMGDTNVVISIVDTGTDLYHPDLINSIKYNYDDPINGEDSDNDGFVDNFYGWDLGENNNMPQYNANAHGVHVSGTASATANNGTGIAGAGYNSMFMPVKIDDEYGRLVMAYEGIVYAADRGANVINCSWGGTLGAGPYGRDIVNYAIFNRDVLVVAAAGNSDNQVPLYPASYEHVLSVAATDEDDVKAGFSSYGINVDVSAPGTNILSTWVNSGYLSSGGTSTSAPIASGAAAIMRAHFSDYNALQIAEQLKITTDNIYDIPENSEYTGLLGTGRINLYRALTETEHPSLRLMEHQHTDEEYSLYNANDTMNIAGTFVNFLAPTGNIEVGISSSSPYVEMIDSVFQTGPVETMGSVANNDEPFKIRLKEDIPVNHYIQFKLSYSDNNNYEAVQYFSVFVNIDYLLVDVNRIRTTLTSRGTLGYNYPNYQQGVGFMFDEGRSMIKCAGLIAGKSTSNVVDNIYGAFENSFNQLFIPVETIREKEESVFSDFDVKGSFKDDDASPFGLNIKVDQYAYAWEESPKDKFIILEYDIINTSDDEIGSFYAGFFADWIITDNKQHRAFFDAETLMGYAYSATGGYYKGISLISEGQIRHYAFDNKGFGGSINISDGFTNFEKYTALKTNRTSAGVYDKDNDISTLVSTGPYSFSPGDTVKVVFGVIAGDHLNDLKNSAKIAYDLYHGLYDDNDTVTIAGYVKADDNIQVFPVPFTNQLNIAFEVEKPEHYSIKVLNLQGKTVRLLLDEYLQEGQYHFSFNMPSPNVNNEALILQIRAGNKTINRKIIQSN